MNSDDVFPSKYLKAADLNGRPVTVTIKSAPYETLKNPEGKEQGKTVLYFVRGKKALPLNIVNWDSAAEICGDDTDGLWATRSNSTPRSRDGPKTVPASAFGAARNIAVGGAAGSNAGTDASRNVAGRERRCRTSATTCPESAFRWAERGRCHDPRRVGICPEGLQIFPCQPRAKRPATANGPRMPPHGPGPDPAWWHHEPAFNCRRHRWSRVSRRRRRRPTPRLNSQTRRKAEHGTLPATIEAITARGRHVYSQDDGRRCAQFRQARSHLNRYQGYRRLACWRRRAYIRPGGAIAGPVDWWPRHCRRASVAAGQDRNT